MGILDPPGISLATGDARYGRAPGYFNIGPTTTRKMRKPLASVRATTGSMKLLCVGDSTTWGAGGNGTNFPLTQNYPAYLRAALNSYYAPTAAGVVSAPSSIPGSTQSVTTDTRFSAGTGWILSTQGFGNGSAFQAPGGTTAALTFTPGTNCDTFDIFYARTASTGSIAVSVDGGTVTNQSTANATNSIGKVTIGPGSASTSHVISITPSGGSVFILGIDPYVTGASVIRVSNAGVSSSMTSHWNSSGSYGAIDMIKAWAPDLSIVMLGINDAYGGVSVSTYTTNMTAIAAGCAVSGDVILMSLFPSQDTTAAGLESQYATACQTLALSAGYGFIDIFARFQSWVIANSNGWMFDAKHPKAEGYGDAANAVIAAVRNI